MAKGDIHTHAYTEDDFAKLSLSIFFPVDDTLLLMLFYAVAYEIIYIN